MRKKPDATFIPTVREHLESKGYTINTLIEGTSFITWHNYNGYFIRLMVNDSHNYAGGSNRKIQGTIAKGDKTTAYSNNSTAQVVDGFEFTLVENWETSLPQVFGYIDALEEKYAQ